MSVAVDGTNIKHSAEAYQRDSVLIAASAALTAVSVALLAAGGIGASLQLDDYGLISSFRPSFYVGLALLPAASACLWITRRKVDRYVVIQLLILLAVLWLSPYILESTARFRSSYKNFGPADWFLNGGGYDPNHVIYHNWPLFPATMATITRVTGLAPETLLALFPFVIQIAYLAPLAILMRSARVPDNRWWAGVWFFYIFNWTGQDYFSPQALAFVFYLSLLALFAHVAAQRHGRFGAPLMALALGLYGLAVVDHVLTSGLVLAVIAGLTFGGQFRNRSLLVTAALMYVGWQAFGAVSFFDFSRDRVLDGLFDVTSFIGLNVEARLKGSPEHALVGRLRMLMTLLAFSLAGSCFVMLIVHAFLKRRRFFDGRKLVMKRGLGWVFAVVEDVRLGGIPSLPQPARFAVLSLLGLAAVGPVYVYGGEMLIRILLFSLPILAFVLVSGMLWRIHIAAIIVALSLMAPMHLLVHYGNESYDYISPGELEGIQWVSANLNNANIVGGYPAAAFENTKNLEWRYGVKPGKSVPPDVGKYLYPDQYRWLHHDWAIFVVVNRGDIVAASLFYNEDDFGQKLRSAIAEVCNFNQVFDNGDFTVFRWSRTCPGTPAVSDEAASP